MKKYFFILIIFTMFMCIHINTAYSQTREEFPQFDNVQKVAQSGYQFLKIDAGARGAAMAGAIATLEGDASTVFGNPAGLTSIQGQSIFVGYTNWFADMQHQAFSAAMNLGKYGVVGLNFINLDNGDIKGTAISNSNLGYDDTGNLDVTEMAIGLTYGMRFTERFGAAITAKYCEQDLIAKESSVIAFDVGTLYNTGWNDVKVAVSVQHFSKEIKYVDENFELPLTFRVGFSGDLMKLANLTNEKHKMMIALEGVNPRDYSERVHVGTEYWYNDMFALRGGYKFNYDVESFSLGAGFKYKGVQIDYSYSDFGSILDMVNRFSVIANF